MKKVVIYTGPICNYCSAAKHLLSKKKIRYEEIDIGNDVEKRDEMLKKSNGAKTVPQIFIGDQHVGGNAELQKLDREGKLDSLVRV